MGIESNKRYIEELKTELQAIKESRARHETTCNHSNAGGCRVAEADLVSRTLLALGRIRRLENAASKPNSLPNSPFQK